MNRYIRFCLLLIIGLASSLSVFADNQDFEQEVYERMTELLHNHTYDKANLVVADSIYAESEKRDSKRGMLYADRLRMYVYVALPDSTRLMNVSDEAASLAKDLGDEDAYIEALNVKIQFYIGQDHFFKALQLTKEMMAGSADSHVALYHSYTMMGNIYHYRDMDSVSVQYFEKALQYVDKNDSIKNCLLYRDLSECYGMTGKCDKALDYAKKALDLSETLGSVYYCRSAHSYLIALFEKHDFDTFVTEYNRIHMFDQPVEGLLPDYMQYQLMLRYELIQGHYDEALRLANKIEYKSLRLPAIILCHRMAGHWKQTVDYLDEYKAYADSVRTQMAMDDMLEMDAQMGLNQLKVEKKELEVRNQRITLISIIVITLLCLAGLTFALFRRRTHIRILNQKNEELHEKNEQLNAKNEELAQARDDAERSSQMKTHFIQNMTHEIRTPLHAIAGFSSMATTEMTTEERQQNAQLIQDNVDTMTEMLSDMLLLSDLDGGSHKAKLTKTPAIESQLMALNWAEANVPQSLEFRCPVTLDDTIEVNIDSELLLNVLCKLIDNAGKFTKEGHIELACQLTTDRHVQYSVTDTGKGIPQESAERVFERFVKLDEFIPGVGIGLTICREAVQLMGGTIHLDTTYTSGARFVMEFPIANDMK